MVTQRRILTSIGVSIVCVLTVATPAPGAGPIFIPPVQPRAAGTLKITPERPLDSNALRVTWKADRAPRSGWTYVLSARSGDDINCSSSVQRTIKPTWKRKGALLRFTLRPTDETLWCPTDARVQIDGVTRAGRGVALAQRTVRILDNTATPPLDPPGQNVTLAVQEGSALTVRVPGRPDRSADQRLDRGAPAPASRRHRPRAAQ